MEKKKKKLNLRLVVSATLMGNTLEWYDYSTFGLFVPIFAVIFFNDADPFLAMMQSFFIYGIGQISRPFGGVVFGYIADRWGRKISLLLSILCMTIPIAIISAMPTYLQIGLAAPLLLALFRMIQGFAAGGEFPVVISYLVESSPWKKRGFFGSFAFVGIALGVFLGLIEYSLIHINMSLQSIQQWGWRIPFIVGVLIGCSTFYLRRKLHETPLFKETESHAELIKDPFWVTLKKNKKALGNMFGVAVLDVVSFNVLVICSISHLIHYVHVPIQTALILNILLLVCIQIFLPFMGKLGDRWGYLNVAICAALGFLFLSYPLFSLFDQGPHLVKALGMVGFAILFAGYVSTIPAMFCDIFPTPVRCSGIGFGYNLNVAIFGGLTPISVFYLIDYFNKPHVPAFFMMSAAVVSLLSLWSFKRQRFYLSSKDAAKTNA